MNERQFIDQIAQAAVKDWERTKILPSVVIAQAALESGFGTSDLARTAYNLFGMKASLSGNTWPSSWDGQTYEKQTKEQDKNGNEFTVTAKFRKYSNHAESLKDHSDYLIGARNGSRYRYEGLAGETNYRKAIQIIKDGGYATDVKYVDKVCSLIERYGLAAYDQKGEEVGINIVDATMTRNPCYTSGRTIRPVGFYLHSIGVPCEKARNIINNENRPDAGAAVHAVIQPDGTVLVGLPIYPSKGVAIRNWHGGSGSKGCCNNTHLGIEMTEPETIKYTGGANWIELSDGSNTKAVVLANYRNAVSYFATLCAAFGRDPLQDGVILSHSEGHRRGYATNHADVEHIWRRYGLTMDQFRRDVKTAMAGGNISVSGKPEKTETGNQGINKLSGSLQVIYKGYEGINVRTAPSFGNNVYKVVKEGYWYTVTGISADEKWYQVEEAGRKLYITAIPQYVKFQASQEQKESTAGTGYYRVRKAWNLPGSQIGAFKNKDNAVSLAKMNSGYYVYDNSEKQIYPTIKPTNESYQLRISIPDLRIRKGPGTTYDYQKSNGRPAYTGAGVFTIVEESDGPGASRWGLLKSYAKNRNGWVSLDYGQKVTN